MQEAVPLLRWCDKVAPPAELVEGLVPTKAAQSLQGRAIEASLVPAIAIVYLRSVGHSSCFAYVVVS